MTPVLSSARPSQHARLHEYAALSNDIRVPRTDRLILRLGLWLLLAGARRAKPRDLRHTRALQEMSRERYIQAERDASLLRAAASLPFR